jgi:hypothetical protein
MIQVQLVLARVVQQVREARAARSHQQAARLASEARADPLLQWVAQASVVQAAASDLA